VSPPALPYIAKGFLKGAGESHPIGHSYEQGRTRPRGQRVGIGPDFHH